jgi:dihydrofolate reductase
MRKIKLYIACSLNGKITANNGLVDWLEHIPNPDKNDYGYAAFQQSVDTTIQGYNTYKQVLDWGIDFPYPDTKNYVLSRKLDLENTNQVEFITQNPIDKIREIKSEAGKDIWLIGGGSINTLFLNAGLVDEIQVFVMPIILAEGIEIFAALPDQTNLTLKNTQTFKSGVIEMIYKVEN